MAEADVVEYSSKFTRAKRNVDGSQQPVASNGGSKVTLKRVAVAVLSTLLVATVVARFFFCYKYSQTMDKLQNLTEENEVMKKNVTERHCELKTCETCPQPPVQNTYEQYLKCEEGWERHGTQCYYFSTNKLTWSKSRDECRQRGGDLVKIDSVEEQIFLQQKLREKMNYPEDKHWIGLTDSKTEGTWLWTDGSPLNERLKFWNKNEPDDWKGEDRDGEDCVRMGEKEEMNLNCWFDRSCKVPHKSICEKCVCCGSA